MTDTPTLTAEQIEALAQQIEKMTPGDWTLDHGDTFVYAPLCEVDACTPGWIVEAPEDMASMEPDCAITQWKQNCRGIVALRNAAPALITAARTLAKLRAMLHDADPFMAAYLEQAIARVLAETE